MNSSGLPLRRFAQSARKHRIGKASARHVMDTYEPTRFTDEGTLKLLWVGNDERGRELEVIAVDQETNILVIHVMPTDFKYTGSGEMNHKEKNSVVEKKYIEGPDIDFDKEVVLDQNGVRYTNARIDEMVREIEEFGPYVGRPSLTAPAVHSPEVKARVPKSLKKRLEAEAKRRGKTPSVLIRQALEEFLAK